MPIETFPTDLLSSYLATKQGEREVITRVIQTNDMLEDVINLTVIVEIMSSRTKSVLNL
jgi:uncharacterized protein YprB with RNaseH-like and TPR domain